MHRRGTGETKCRISLCIIGNGVIKERYGNHNKNRIRSKYRLDVFIHLLSLLSLNWETGFETRGCSKVTYVAACYCSIVIVRETCSKVSLLFTNYQAVCIKNKRCHN